MKVTFRLPAMVANGGLSVVGDFNDWTPGATPMHHHDGTHTASVLVEAGRHYAFRYLGEGGEWFNDEAAHDYEPNEFGGMNGVIDPSRASRSVRTEP